MRWSPNTQTVPQLLSRLWEQAWVRLICYTSLLIVALWMTVRVSGPLAIIALSYALATTVNPVLDALGKRGVTRPFGIAIIMLVTLGIAALLFWTVVSQVSSFVASIPSLLDSLPGFLEKILGSGKASEGVQHSQAQLTEYVREQVAAFQANIGPLIGQFFAPDSIVYGRVSGVLNVLGQAGLVLTLAVFFMLDHGRFVQGILKVFPRHWQPRVLTLSDDMSVSFGNYIRAQLLLLVAISGIAGVVLLLLGVPNALALGLLTGLLNLVPLVGMVLAAIPSLLQAIPLGTTKLILVVIFYFILNQVAWNVIAPMDMGRSVKLSAVGIIIALLIGSGVAGLPGALLAIPTASLLQRWMQRYWLTTPAYRGDDSEGFMPAQPLHNSQP